VSESEAFKDHAQQRLSEAIISSTLRQKNALVAAGEATRAVGLLAATHSGLED
jgi:hypothetical protein